MDHTIKDLQVRLKKLEKENISLKQSLHNSSKSIKKLSHINNLAQKYLDVANVIIVVINKDGTILLINKKGSDVLGYDESEIIGKNWFDLCIPKEISKKVKTTFKTVMSGNISTVKYFENLIITKKGDRRIIAWHNTYLKDTEGKIYATLSAGEDVTIRKNAQKSLIQSEEKFRTLAEESPNMIFINKNGHIIYVNKKCSEVTGYSRETLLSPDFDFRSLHAPESQEIVEKAYKKHMQGKNLPPYEYILLTKQGTKINAIITTKIITYENEPAILGIITDLNAIKQTENALKTSEIRYRSLFENSPISLWEEDFSQVKKYLNALQKKGVKNIKKYFEDHSDEVLKCASLVKIINVNKKTLQLYKAKSKKKFIENLDKVFTNESYKTFIDELVVVSKNELEFETETVNKTLQNEDLHVSLRLSFSPQGEHDYSHVLVSIVDITHLKNIEKSLSDSKADLELRVKLRTKEVTHSNKKLLKEIENRKKIELDLRESEKKYKRIFDLSPEAIVILDNKGVFVDVNNRMYDWLGYTPSETIGKHLRDQEFLTAESKLAAISNFTQRVQGKNLPTYELEFIGKNGERRIGLILGNLIKDAKGQVIGDLIMALDVTEQKRAEDALKKAYTTTREIIENAPFGIFVICENGTIELTNYEMIKISGDTYEQFMGINVFNLPSYINLGLDKKIKEGMKGKYFRLDTVEYVAHYSKKKTIRNFVGIPLEEDGEKKVLMIVEDVTEKKRMEEELIRTQHLESIGVLAGGIAHDFNNILNVMLGNVSLAKMLSDKNSDVYKRLDKAEMVSARAKDLTQQLLTFSRGGAPIKKPGSIADLIKDTIGFVLTGSKIKTHITIDTDLWPVEFDPGQMSQVINNLIINAKESMGASSGILKIEAKNVTYQKDKLPLIDDKYIMFSITDSGEGIKEEDLHKIFDPYFTTKAHGNGLGLTTTYSIIKKHGGLIEVNSTYKKGSVFTVYLPAFKKQLGIIKDSPETSYQGSGKILLMDDDESFREIAEKMLNKLGYTPVLATNGTEALHLYKRAHKEGDPFLFVIMDLTVRGGLGGKEGTEKIRSFDPDARVIVCSGYSNDPILSNFEEYGFCGVLAKPFTIQELGKTLLTCITCINKKK